MKYKPWKGFTLIGLGVVIDLLPGFQHRTGLPTFLCFIAAWGWSQS